MVMFDGDEEDLDEQEVLAAIAMREKRQAQSAKRRRKMTLRVHCHARFCTQVYTCPHISEIESLLKTANACRPKP